MPSVDVVWKANCRDPQTRYRLLGYLHRLADLNNSYLRRGGHASLSLVAEGQRPPRDNVEVVDATVPGPVLISSEIGPHPQTLITRAREAGLSVVEPANGAAAVIEIDSVRLRGLDFTLFDPKDLHPGNNRMSFVFMECPEHYFLDGRLVARDELDGQVYLSHPRIQLRSFLEDWTDCLFSWIRFFLIGDFWWQRREELQGYDDYRGVFKELQTATSTAHAEDATFDAVLSTFTQHAEHGITDVQALARVEGE